MEKYERRVVYVVEVKGASFSEVWECLWRPRSTKCAVHLYYTRRVVIV